MALKVGELYASFGIDSSGLNNAISGIEKKCSEIAGSLAKTGAVLSTAITAPIVAFGKDVFNVGTEFEAQMSRVQGISGATAAQLELLTETAKELGASSVYSASEAAEGMEYLASAGFGVNEIISAMPGMLNLAASSGEDLATSADIAASVLRGFGMEAAEAGHVADVLASNAAKTNAAVYDTGEAMKYVAPLANTMGLSFEEVTAAIGLMSNAGIKGSQAGTTLRGAFSRLAKPTDVMLEKMDELGISFYNSEGQMKSISDIVAMLQTSMSGLTDEQQQNALVTLFGQEALSGMMVLMEAGPEALDELATAYENCGGAAQDMADIMLDNLKGDVEGLNGSLETLKLNLYDRLLPAMRGAVQGASGLVDGFNALDGATKDVVYKVAGLAAATGPLIAALGGAVAAAGKLLPAMAALVSPIGIVASGIALFAVAAVDANNDIGKAFAQLSKKAKASLKKFNSNIQSSMQTISKRIPALSASIVEGIQNIIPELADTAMLAITGFMDVIGDNASAIADVGKSIVTSVANGISRNLPSLISSGAEMMAGIASAIIRNIPEIIGAAAEIVTAIWNGIKNTDWAALGKEIVGAIKDGVSGLKDLILGDEATDTSTWAEAGSKIWESIKSGFSATGDWLKELVLGDSYTPDSSWADVGSRIWDTIKSGISEAGDWIKEKVLGDSYTPDASWGEVGARIWDAIKRGFSATGDWIKELVLGDDFTADSSWTDVGEKIVGKIAEGLSSLDLSNEAIAAKIGDMSNIASALAEKIVSGKVDFVAKATTFITSLMQGFNGVSLDGFSDIFNLLASSIIDGIGNGIEAIGDAGAKIIGKIADILGSEGFADFAESLKNIAASLISKLVEQIPKVANAASDIISAIAGLFNSEGYEQYLGGVVDFAGAIIDALVEAIPEVGNAANRIVGAIGELLTGDAIPTFLGEMTDLASAIIDGIVDAIPGLVDSAKNIVTTIGDTLKDMDWASIGDKLGGFATALLDGIISALEALGSSDFAGLITAIGDGIISAAEGLATAAGTLVGKFVGFLLDPSNLAKIAQVGVQFIAELVKGVIGLGASVIEGAAGVLTNAIVGFFRGIFGIQVDPYVEEMMNQFYDMEFDVPVERFDGLGKACGAALIDAMGATLTSTKKLEDAVYAWGVAVENKYSEFMPKYEWLGNESVVNLYRGFLSGMESNTATAEESARAAALLIGLGYGENLINALDVQQPEVAAALYEMFESDSFVDLQQLASEFGYEIGDLMGISIPEGYSMAIVDGKPAIIQKSQELIAAGEAAIAEGWNADELMAGLWDHTFRTAFAEIAEWKPELVAELEGLGVEAGSLLGVALPDGVAEGLKSGQLSIEEAAAEIAAAAAITQEDVAQVVTDNTAKGEETGQAVATGQDNAQPSVSEASTGLHDTVTGAFEPLPEEITETTDAAMSGMETSILNGKAPSEAAALQVSDAVVQQFVLNMSEANGVEIGTKWVNAIRTSISSSSGALSSEAARAARTAVTAASAALSSSAGSGIGSNFARGIAAGIRAGSSAISAAAQSAAQSALSAAKSKLGIKSPSKVAEKEVGWMWDAGLAQGISGKMALVERAASDVSDALHSSFFVGDPSRGTVYTSGDTIRQTARRTAEATGDRQSILERADAIGRSIADRLIESGALDSSVYMDGDKVGEKVSNPVSRAISRRTRQTIRGRSAQGVMA